MAVFQQAVLGGSGGVDDLVDGAHRVSADICLDDLPGRVKSLVLAGLDAAPELIQLDVDLMLEDRPATLLLGIVCGELPQLREIVGDLLESLLVGIEIFGISGDKEAALASLGVLNCPFEGLGCRHHLDGMGDPLLASFQLRHIAGDLEDLDPHQHERGYQDQGQSLPQGPL